MTFRIQHRPDACQRARTHAGLSRPQAARSLGVTATHVGYVESGQRAPSVGLLKRMADVYGVPMTTLFDEVTEDVA